MQTFYPDYITQVTAALHINNDYITQVTSVLHINLKKNPNCRY